MKIVWVSHSGEFGGAELCLVESVKGLRTANVESLVVVPNPGPLVARLITQGATVQVVHHTWWARAGRNWHRRAKGLAINSCAIVKLCQFFREQRPDLVVTNTSTIPSGAVAARLVGIPHVWYLHEFAEHRDDLRFDFGLRFTYRTIDRLSRRVLVISRTVHDCVAGRIAADKLRILYPAVDLAEPSSPSPRADTPFTIIVAGHKTPIKRQEDAVRALACLIQWRIPAKLTLIGNEEPRYGKYLRELTHEQGVQAHIDFACHTESLPSLLTGADLVVNCCPVESLGRVTIEAMKTGRSVIGAAAGGTIELIGDGKTGLLYQPGDPADLAEKIALLYHDRLRLAGLGRAAQQWATQMFSLEKHTGDLLRVFDEAIHTSA